MSASLSCRRDVDSAGSERKGLSLLRNTTRIAAVAVALSAVGLILASPASAQVVRVEPQRSAAVEASAQTTIMLDPLYLARVMDRAVAYSVPIDGPAGGFVASHPELLRSYAIAKVGEDGTVLSRCFGPGELAGQLGGFWGR